MEDRTTDFLTPIYVGLPNITVLRGRVDHNTLFKLIVDHERVFMLGHGSPNGLFLCDGLLHDAYGKALANKDGNLCIWCNADVYAIRNRLSGFVTGMFVSETGEASMFGVPATLSDIHESNDRFSEVVREVMDEGAPMSEVRNRYLDHSNHVSMFNCSRLYEFKKGVPTPSLHGWPG